MRFPRRLLAAAAAGGLALAVSAHNLDADDVDALAFAITPADLAYGVVPVSASALPPACNQTKNNYPMTALMAPLGTCPDLIPGTVANVPFPVPPG